MRTRRFRVVATQLPSRFSSICPPLSKLPTTAKCFVIDHQPAVVSSGTKIVASTLPAPCDLARSSTNRKVVPTVAMLGCAQSLAFPSQSALATACSRSVPKNSEYGPDTASMPANSCRVSLCLGSSIGLPREV